MNPKPIQGGRLAPWAVGAFLLCLVVQAPAAGAEASEGGFIQVAPSGRYFQHEDGTPFFPVGIHGYDMIQQNVNRAYWEVYFKLLNRHGVNVLRMLIDGRSGDGLTADPGCWFESNNLENPVPDCGDAFDGGCDLSCTPTYNPVVEETLTYFFALAEKYGIYLQVGPLAPGVIAMANGETYPHLATAGGPITGSDPFEKTNQFLTNGKAVCLQMKRFQWLVERWGDNPHLFSWELMNEMDLFANMPDNLAQIRRWIDTVASYVKSIDPNHLITVSASNPLGEPTAFNKADRNLEIWNNPEMDVVTYHGYGSYFDPAFAEGNIRSELDTIQYQLKLHTALTEQVIPNTCAPERPNRPVHLNEEFGALWAPLGFRHDPLTPWSDGKMADHFRMAKWVHAASGSAGTPVQYYTDGFYGVGDAAGQKGFWGFSYEDYRSLQVLVNLLRGVDWSNLVPVPADGRVSAPEIATMATADASGDLLLAWLLHHTETPLPDPLEVTFSGLSDRAHQVVWYSDRTGEVLRTDTLEGTGGTLSVPASLLADPAPAWDWAGEHVAVLVRPQQEGTGDINPDSDGDGVIDLVDNCPQAANADQQDQDGDGVGDLCDNCPSTFNRLQGDFDGNGAGDECQQPCRFGDLGKGPFYVDFENGLNSNTGREGDPWRTILYAKLNSCYGSEIRVATCGNGVVDGDEACDGLLGCTKGVCSKDCFSCEMFSCAQVPPPEPLEGGPAGGVDGRASGAAGQALSFFLPLAAAAGCALALRRKERHGSSRRPG